MPLDLIGKGPRTIYAVGCSEDNSEDFVRFLLNKCGAVEAWDYVGDRTIVIFRSSSSANAAVTQSGMFFVDLTRPVLIWKASDPPPPGAETQALLKTEAHVKDPEEEAAERKKREERKRRREEALSIIQAEEPALDYSIPSVRSAKLKELCYRQLKALCVITRFAVAQAEQALKEQEAQTAGRQEVEDEACDSSPGEGKDNHSLSVSVNLCAPTHAADSSETCKKQRLE